MLSDVLAKARAHLAGGWAPLISRDASGAMCGPDEEGIARFCIVDALLVAAQGDLVAAHAGARALGVRLHPVKLGDWEADPKRTLDEVLSLFALAQRNAAAKENR